MSIVVELDDLPDELGARGPGFLLTSDGGPGRPHVMHVVLTFDGPRLRAGIGRTASANITANPEVAVVWPPVDDGGMSLIVDATATVDPPGDEGGTPVAVLTPVGAILHRPAR